MAGYSEFIEIVGSGPAGTLIGSYGVTLSEADDFGAFAPSVTVSITQGSTTAMYCAPHCTNANPFLQTITVTSPFQFGVPFDFAASLSSFSNSPGDQGSSASIQFLGFADQAGNPLQFAFVPEPATWATGALAAVLIGIGRYRRRRR